MDTKLLDAEIRSSSLGSEALLSMASRQKRREYFYRSLLRCALLTLLFIAFGCFFAIYMKEKGHSTQLFISSVSLFDLRSMLKELFSLSLIPSSCFALCCCFGGRLHRLCDTLFPAVYGMTVGASYYTALTALFTSFSVSYTVNILPYLCQTLCVTAIYTLFCPVCASYGKCRRQKSTVSADMQNCFTYFLISLTLLALSLLLRDAAAFSLECLVEDV